MYCIVIPNTLSENQTTINTFCSDRLRLKASRLHVLLCRNIWRYYLHRRLR